MTLLRIDRYGQGYDVAIDPGLLGDAAALQGARGRTVALVTDETVFSLYGEAMLGMLREAGAAPYAVVVPPGEASKSHGTLLKLYAEFASMNLTRSDLVVALGGGVIGDLAGFAAATFLRGVELFQIPTTLLAQVDSSVGGKVAVDLPEGKNLVGLFYPPTRVLVDPDVLDTLPARQLSAGMAEAIKHAALFDADLFARMERLGGIFAREARAAIIERNIALKRDIVQRDPNDTGERMLLNFGHTLGHAVEVASGFSLLHGEAVSIGMVAAARWGERLGITRAGTHSRLAALLASFGLPTALPASCPASLLSQAMRQDKKRAGGDIAFAFIEDIGKGFLKKLPYAELTKEGGLLT